MGGSIFRPTIMFIKAWMPITDDRPIASARPAEATGLTMVAGFDT